MQASGPALSINLQEILGNLFMVLTEKEVTVVKKRFALFGQPKQTLEKIGKQFKVTRERIRQIESIALGKLKRTVRTTRLDEVNDMAKGILRMQGGLMREDELVSLVLKRIQGSTAVDGSVLRLSFSIDSEMSNETRTPSFVPQWRLASLSGDDVSLIVDSMVKILKKRKTCMKQEEIVSAIQSLNLFKDRVPSPELIGSSLRIDERLKEIDEGWGLTEWRFVRPPCTIPNNA
jgi:transcriptional regulator